MCGSSKHRRASKCRACYELDAIPRKKNPQICPTCQKLFIRTRIYQTCCSRACGVIPRAIRKAQRLAELKSARLAEAEQRKLDRERKRHETEAAKSITGRCKGCDQEFIYRRRGCSRKFCSKKCRPSRRKSKPKVRESRKHTSRARKYGIPRVYSINLRKVCERDKWTCRLCSQPILPLLIGSNDPDAPSIDHIIPLSAKGSPGHVWNNVQLACRACNTQKGTKYGQSELRT